MTKTERLEFLLSLDPQMSKDFYIEYVPKRGWTMQSFLPMHFYDNGIDLGETYAEAKPFLMKLIKPDVRNWWTEIDS
jgi:hypothetical protein